MRTVVLLAFLVSSVAFSSEQEHSSLKEDLEHLKCSKPFDSGKFDRCFAGKWSFGDWFLTDFSNTKCISILGYYFQCRMRFLQDRVAELEEELELERQHREQQKRMDGNKHLN